MVKQGFIEILRDIGRGTYRRGLGKDVKIRGRVNYPIYSLIKRGQSIIMRYKRVKVSDFSKYFNINKTNRIVGFMPDFVGATKSKIVSSKNYVMDFIFNNFDWIVSNTSESCVSDLIESINSPRVVYSAGYDTCSAHLKEYFKDNTTEDVLNRENILDIISLSNFKWFAAPVCDFFNGFEIHDYVRANYDSYPGHYSSKIFGNKKLLGDTLSRNVAYKIWTKMHDKPIKNMYLWKILGREKDIKLDINSGSDIEVGTRVVLTCESPITYFLMWISQKFNFILGYANWDRTFNICGEFDATKSSKLTVRALDYDYVLEADWSYYDSNIDTNFLEIGAAILCSGMPDDKLHNNIITTFIFSVVTKYVILPPGVVVELNRSQPSGHPAGTLINCIVNLMYWCIIGYKIYGADYHNNMHVEVYGDDTRAYFKDHPNLVNIDLYISEVGLKSDKVINNFRSTKIKYDKCSDIDFLKRRFDEATFEWNHKKMFDKWLYQSRNRNLTDQIEMVVSYLAAVPTDSDLKVIISKFIEWIYDKYPTDINYNTRKVIESCKLLLDEEAIRSDSFKFHLSGKRPLDSYQRKQNLFNFSVLRYKGTWINEKFSLNYNASKHLVLYSLGLDDITLGSVRFSDFSGTNRPPPLFVCDSTYVLERYERLLKFEHAQVMNKLRNVLNLR